MTANPETLQENQPDKWKNVKLIGGGLAILVAGILIGDHLLGGEDVVAQGVGAAKGSAGNGLTEDDIRRIIREEMAARAPTKVAAASAAGNEAFEGNGRQKNFFVNGRQVSEQAYHERIAYDRARMGGGWGRGGHGPDIMDRYHRPHFYGNGYHNNYGRYAGWPGFEPHYRGPQYYQGGYGVRRIMAAQQHYPWQHGPQGGRGGLSVVLGGGGRVGDGVIQGGVRINFPFGRA